MTEVGSYQVPTVRSLGKADIGKWLTDPLQGSGILIWGDLADFSSPDCPITLTPERRCLCFALIMVAKMTLSVYEGGTPMLCCVIESG